MAPFQYQFLPQETYRSPFTTTVASLMGAPDRARAAATMASGQAWAGAAQQIGNQVSTSMHDLMRYQEEAPRREMEQMQLRNARQQQADDQDTRGAFQDAKGDPIVAIKALEAKGNYTIAMKLRAQVNDMRLKGLDELKKTLDLTNERLGTASQMLQGVGAAPDPASAYSAVLPQVRQIVGEQLGGKLPDVYDKAVVDQAMTWGMKASEVIAMRRAATLEATAAVSNALTRTDLADKLTKSTATWAQTIDSPEEWDQMLKTVKHLGGDVATDVLQKFAATYSPAAVVAAKTLLGKDTKYQQDDVLATVNGKTVIMKAGFDPEKNLWFAPGSATPLQNVRRIPPRDPSGMMNPANSAELVKALIENPSIYQDLTDSVKSQLWPDLHRAGFVPPPAKDTGSSRAVAERWKLTQLHKIDENLGYQVITPEQAATQRAEVEASFRAQIGEKPAGTPAKAGGPPAPAAKPAAPPKKVAVVPDAVKSLLTSQKPGTYTLSDGTKWIVDKSGAVTPGS